MTQILTEYEIDKMWPIVLQNSNCHGVVSRFIEFLRSMQLSRAIGFHNSEKLEFTFCGHPLLSINSGVWGNCENAVLLSCATYLKGLAKIKFFTEMCYFCQHMKNYWYLKLNKYSKC